jgi:hypothetical protein
VRAYPPEERTARLPGELLQLVLPALVYVPLCQGADRFARIVRNGSNGSLQRLYVPGRRPPRAHRALPRGRLSQRLSL